MKHLSGVYLGLVHPFPAAHCSTHARNLVGFIFKVKLVVIGKLQGRKETLMLFGEKKQKQNLEKLTTYLVLLKI